jgi:cyclophilin family peptidyl-prolyl cis-trans isomerase
VINSVFVDESRQNQYFRTCQKLIIIRIPNANPRTIMRSLNTSSIIYPSTCYVPSAAAAFVIAFCALLTPSFAVGQAQTQLNDEKSFSQINAELLANERAVNKLFSSIPIGFPRLQKQHMKDIDALRAKNVTLLTQLESAALRAFEQDPAKNPKAAQYVYSLMMKCLDGTSGKHNFNPQRALEIADMMLKSDMENDSIRFEEVAFQAFRASYALQDFGRAELMLKKIAARGTPILPQWSNALADAKQKWQRELMIRRLESNANDLPRVKFKTTEGDIVVELFENHAPQTVGNFISLVEKNFYNDLDFFIVRPGEFAKTGCQHGNGTGNPGYNIPCECFSDQIRHHFTGTLSMTTTGRNTGGSQFFITHQANPVFDGKHTAFGRVMEGMDVVYKLRMSDGVNAVGGEPSSILKATVIRKRNHVYAPSRVANKDTGNKVGASDTMRPLNASQGLTSGR